MATIKSPCLFFVTSPRTPFKMREEIALLVREFAGDRWIANTSLQAAFMRRLARMPEFEGGYNQNDPALSARDRITRGPKALGFVNLDKIALSPAGENFLDDDLAEEALLRQVLKFQLPSPFHKANPKIGKTFCAHPYLEILRLVHDLGRLAFDELCLFGMQLTDWHDFVKTAESIRQFRIQKNAHKGQYKKWIRSERDRIVAEVFAREIAEDCIKTRESRQASLSKFISTKAGNMRDYADACLRYLRATGLVTVSNPGRTISIIESRRDEVEYILATVGRDPVFVSDEENYRKWLFDANSPVLLTDDRKTLEDKAVVCGAVVSVAEAKSVTVTGLKKRIKRTHEIQREAIVNSQITELKSFAKYDEVVGIFDSIKSKEVYDPPLALEWNAWRTMTMMDGGDIRANLTFDDAGNPLSTAPGNNADIVCDYGSFIITVEVTMMTGNKQFDAEGEPVARHLGIIKAKTGKDAFCLFVAPRINASTISHFFMLHRTNVKYYGGKSVVIPLTLDRFVGMLTQSKNNGSIPSPDKLRSFCEYSMSAANAAADEEEWYATISRRADGWLGCGSTESRKPSAPVVFATGGEARRAEAADPPRGADTAPSPSPDAGR